MIEARMNFRENYTDFYNVRVQEFYITNKRKGYIVTPKRYGKGGKIYKYKDFDNVECELFEINKDNTGYIITPIL